VLSGREVRRSGLKVLTSRKMSDDSVSGHYAMTLRLASRLMEERREKLVEAVHGTD
jgi:hypothetical protein